MERGKSDVLKMLQRAMGKGNTKKSDLNLKEERCF